MGRARLQGRKVVGQAHAPGRVEVDQVILGVRPLPHDLGVQDHAEVLVDPLRVGRAVVIRLLDVVGAELQVALGEVHGLAQVGHARAAHGRAEDGGDGAAHLHARLVGLLDAALAHLK